MSLLMFARRLLGRHLPPGAKALIRRVVPARLLRVAPSTRRFTLVMPTPPVGMGAAHYGLWIAAVRATR